jgi:hypothetical protein
MKGTSGVGKAAAGANDIMGATESRVKSFLHTFIQIGQFGKSFRIILRNTDLARENKLYAAARLEYSSFWLGDREGSFLQRRARNLAPLMGINTHHNGFKRLKTILDRLYLS